MTPLALAPRPEEKLGALERLEALCDPGSLQLIRADVISGRMGTKAVGGDGVLGATGSVVSSTQVANVRIESRGRGAQGEAQTVGWLSRFFLSFQPF